MEGDDKAVPPEEWNISRICEEFPAFTPEQARDALDNDDGLIAAIVELRAFARAHAILDRAAQLGQDVKPSPMIGRVVKLQLEMLKERTTT